MPSRTYQVNYELNGISTNAVKAFESLKAPMSEVSSQMKSLTEGMQMLNKQLESFKALSENLVFKPKINTKSFADALATMESNVKMSSMRMRASLEAALSGSTSDHARINNLLGTGNWKRMESEQKAELKNIEKNMKLLKNIRDKFSSGKSDSSIKAKKEADAWLSAYKNSGIDPYERAARLLKQSGIGGILSKSANGWGLAGGDSRSKLKDLISKMEAESTELSKSIEQAAKKNQQALGNVAKETSFNRKGSFVERMLGVSPEQLKDMQPILGSLNSFMNGVQETQTKMREVVKRTPKAMPARPSNLLNAREYRKLYKESLPTVTEVFPRENEIKSWENLSKKRPLSFGENRDFQKLLNAKKIWLESQKLSGTLTDSQKATKEKYESLRSQRDAYAKQLRDWRKKPYTETIEKVPETITKVRNAASKPIKIDIRGNFTSQTKSVAELSAALSALPKTAIEIPINITMPNGIVQGLSTVSKELKAIEATRGKLAKGSYKGLVRATEAIGKQKATENVVNIKAAFDNSALSGEIKATIDATRKLVNENTLFIKAKVDIKGVIGDFKSFLSKLKASAKNANIIIKTKLDLSNIGKQFREKISALKKAAKSANIAVKAKIDSTGINKKFREAISKLKATASKNIITIKPKFDLADITKNLKQSLSGLAKSTKATMPSIKVRLDITEAKASLQKLIAEIKAASPQTIKVGTSQSRAAIAEVARQTTSSAKAEASKNNMASAVASGAIGGRIASSSRPGFVDRLRKHMYPLTGNVSLGASTPVALDMAKGMGMMYGIGGAMNLVTGGFNDAMEYQNTMETAEEILRKTYKGNNFTKDFNSMSSEVRRVAKQTKFTAPQAADATRFMAMAGLNIPMIKASVAPIADVAVIGDNDFGQVADKMTNIQTAFGIKPERMRHVADAITNTFTHTNTDMMMLAESMQYAAPMAHLAGMNIEDTLAMIGIMGNSGIQASMAGTTLRMMMQNTLNPNKKQAALWKKLGVGTRDSDGNLRNMIDILADVKTAAKAKSLPMADVVSNLFRVTASAGAGALIQNIDQVKELANQNQLVGNVSGEISTRKQNTAKGMWAQMTSAFTEANLKVFEQFQGDIIKMIKAVRDYFSSNEAVENLRNTFSLIKDLMEAFGSVAKFWLSLYNQFGGLIKFIVKSQFYIAQIGLAIKPIMSLVNVFGGLKNLALDFVGALSGVAAIKKASIITGMMGAISPNVSNTNTAKRQLQNSAINSISNLAYNDKLQKLQSRKLFYEVKANRLKNSVQIKGSSTGARMAINPLWFAPMSTFGGFAGSKNYDKDYYTAKNFMWERSWLPNKYDLKMQQLHYQNAKTSAERVANEIAALKNERLLSLKQASEMRKTSQFADLALMYRYHNMGTLPKNNPSGEAVPLYVPGRNKKIDTFFQERKNRMDELREIRRAEQLKNASGLSFYRASRISGRGRWSSLGRTIGGGFNAAYTALSFKNMTAGLFNSIKSGFLSLLSGLGRVFAALTSPISLAIAGITALGYAAYSADKEMRRQAIESNRITNKMIANTSQSSNYGVINYGKNNPRTKYFSIVPNNSVPTVKKRNNSYYAAWDDRLFKDGANATKEARAWNEAFIAPNKEVFGRDYSLFSQNAMLANSIKMSNDLKGNKATYGTDTHFLAQNAGNKDLKNIQRLAQLSTLYIEGANSKKASQLRDRIVSLRKSLSDGKISDEKYQSLTSDLMQRNGLSLDAIEKIPKFTGNPATLKNKSDWSNYQQYHYGMYNQLMAEINGEQNTLSGYYKGVSEIKSGVTKYSLNWWKAIKLIIGGMRTTVDAAGNAVQIKFDSGTGLVQWNNIIAQIKKFNKNFKDTMYNYLNLMGQAYGAMVDNGIVGNYYKDWRKFYIEQNKHRVVSKNDARYYYSSRGYSGQALENEVNNGLWTKSGNAGGTERAKIRQSLAITRADEAKRSHDKINKSTKELQNSLKGGTSNSNGASYSSPIADAAKDTNNKLGHNYGKDTVTARPTQINIHVDKLANFDKIQFLKGEERDLTDALQRAIAEAFANMVPMVDSLVSNDKVVTA